jgi:low affinity Fe/Cu permease
MLNGQLFERIVRKTTLIVGAPTTFFAVLVAIVVWLAAGPYYRFDADWNFLANTSTAIVTTLMVFLLQASQNRDSKAIHVKLDEVIRALHHADNFMIAVESLSEDELDRLISHYRAIRLVRGLAPAPEIYHGGSERLDADGGEGPSSA